MRLSRLVPVLVVVFASPAVARAQLSATPAWTTESDQAGASLGNRVASAGDVNGDGYDDVIVSAYSFNNGQNQEGKVFVHHGSASGLASRPAWTAEVNQ